MSGEGYKVSLQHVIWKVHLERRMINDRDQSHANQISQQPRRLRSHIIENYDTPIDAQAPEPVFWVIRTTSDSFTMYCF